MSGLELWLLILAMGIIVFLIRFSFLGLAGRFTLPLPVRRALRFLPPAIFSALVLPALVYPEGGLELGLGNERLVAGLAALLVAWRSKNILLTLLVGVGALLLCPHLG